jgi:hypothetical protein
VANISVFGLADLLGARQDGSTLASLNGVFGVASLNELATTRIASSSGSKNKTTQQTPSGRRCGLQCDTA